MGVLYRCTCTRADIARNAVHTGPDGPIYPGTCKRHPPAPDLPAAWRLDVDKALALTGPLSWTDECAGQQRANPALLGDVVLVRKDLPASYHLAATLDDATDAINVVTRGADLFAATHIHRLLQALLDLPVPVWLHHPLLLDEQGRKLAKRRNSPSLADMRSAGGDGRALADALRARRFPAGISLSQSPFIAA
jgi:glutamyl-Q tRNA(Asp) synthetase